MWRRLLMTIAVSTVAIGFGAGGPAGGADITDDNQVPILNMAGDGDLHIMSDDSLEEQVVDPPSMLAYGPKDQEVFCTSADTGACAGQSKFWYYAHLPICDATVTVDCIVSLSATTSSGSTSGTFTKYFPDKSDTSYTGKPSLKLPTGRAPSVWSIPGAPHSAGSDYALVVRLVGGTDSRAGASFQVVLTAVSIKTDADTDPTYKMGNWVKPGQMAGPASDRGKFRCAYWGEKGACLLSRSFPQNTRYTVKVRLASEPTGWLHGRINDPTISFTQNGEATDVEITAAPIQVPAVAVAKKHLEFPTSISGAFSPGGKYPGAGSRQPGGAERTDLTKRNAEYNIVSYKDDSFDQLRLISDVISDTASYAPWIWRVRTLSNDEMSKAGACLTTGTGVKGIVTTNATVYGSGPPAFNATDKTLDYKVAAPHYTRTKEEFKGSYYLIMRSDVARCFYKFSSAPVKATISVVEDNGKPATAVTAMSESKGWLKLSATGFTHSAPTVKVALAQDEASESTTTSTPSAPSTVATTGPATGSPAASAAAPTARTSRGKTISGASLARTAKLTVAKGSRISLSVSRATASVCRVSGSAVRALKKGSCSVVVTVTPAKGKKVSRTVRVTVA